MELRSFVREQYFLITLIWIGSTVIINPIGNFPLNDSWAYASNVYNLTERATFDLSEWPGMTLIVHMLYGSLFTEVFGFSFTVLRISTLLLGLATLLIFVKLIDFYKSKRGVTILTLLLAFNPLYVHLSHTFHTDIPFLFTFLVALFFYKRYLDNRKLIYLVAGITMVMFATLIRQIGIGLPLAFLLYTLIFFRSNRIQLVGAIVGVVLCAMTLFLYEEFLVQIGELSPRLGTVNMLLAEINWASLTDAVERILIILFYVGLLLFPVVLVKRASLFDVLKSSSMMYLWFFLFIGIFFSYPFLPSRNVIYDFGLGPVLLKEALMGYQTTLLPPIAKFVILLLGSLGGASFVVLLIRQKGLFSHVRSKSKTDQFKSFVLIIVLGYLCFLLLEHYFFDRYLLLLFPLLIIVVAEDGSRVRTNLALIPLVLISLFSVFATQNYLGWNRVRWKQLNELMSRGVSPNQIDGGFEFNGWYNTGPRLLENDNRSWWFVNDDQYTVGFQDICGYKKLDSASYFSLLTFQRKHLFVLEKDERFPKRRAYQIAQNLSFDGGRNILPFYDKVKIDLNGIQICSKLTVGVELDDPVDIIDLEIRSISGGFRFNKRIRRSEMVESSFATDFLIPQVENLTLTIRNPKVQILKLKSVEIR